jgi:L-rhamnose mutarotase
MKRYCLALDLVDDPELIAEYEHHHNHIWPEIVHSIRSAGIDVLDIYRTGNRLFMIIEASDSFSFAEKGKADAANAKVQEWETLMWKFQQALPWAKPGEKWILMDKIFSLPAHSGGGENVGAS